MPEISVIIPSYNRAGVLPRALDSVLSQTSPASEVILVDDGSTDETRELIQAHYPEIRYIYQDNKGVSTARNTGIRHASGEWLAFLDSDDCWHQDKLQIQSALLRGASDHALVHSNEIWIRNGIRVNAGEKHRKRGGYIFPYCLPLCAISPSSVLIRRAVLDQVGKFDESLPACEDYDLWLRICSRFPVLYTDKELVIKHGGHADQLSRKYWGMDRFRIHAMAKLLEDSDLRPDYRRQCIDMLKYKCQILLNGARKRDNSNVIMEFSRILEDYSQLHQAPEQP